MGQARKLSSLNDAMNIRERAHLLLVVIVGLCPIPTFAFQSGWVPVFQFPQGNHVLEFHQLGADIIYAELENGRSGLISKDGGHDWASIEYNFLESNDVVNVVSVVVSPALTSPLIYVLSFRGQLFVSSDYGQSWQLVHQVALHSGIQDMLWLGPNRVIAAFFGRIWFSEDQGASWQGLNDFIEIGTAVIAKGYGPQQFIVTIAGGMELCCGAVYISNDSGNTWTEHFLRWLPSYSAFALSSDTILIGAGGVVAFYSPQTRQYTFSNTISSWGEVFGIIRNDFDSRIYMATRFGVYRADLQSSTLMRFGGNDVTYAGAITTNLSGDLVVGGVIDHKSGIYTFGATSLPIQIPENRSKGLIIESVFPNPSDAASEIILQSEVFTTAEMTVYDALGRLVSSSQFQVITGENRIPISSREKLSAGVYVVAIRSGGQLATAKFILTKNGF
jgi:hypothetical protein